MGNNGDELLTTGLTFGDADDLDIVGIGNFHKTLPHNKFGEVDPKAYALFKNVATHSGEYETVPAGYTGTNQPPEANFIKLPVPNFADKLNNPQSARVRDLLTGPTTDYAMTAAPSVRSLSTAAEMTELQWMAILRDTPFINLNTTNTDVMAAIDDIKQHYSNALAANEPGGLRLGTDLPRDGNNVRIDQETLFRCGLLGEDKGPLVSQFFLHDIGYGAQFIVQKVRPYRTGSDYLTDHGTWLLAQNSGRDLWGNGYSRDNDLAVSNIAEPGPPRRLTTMRDIARFVNKDALHQAYFNAALLCLQWNVPMQPGNPYLGYHRQGGFGTFGGPEVLTRVSEVASRALAIAWRQKWEVHRRLRPEAYGGLMQMQRVGLEDSGTFTKRAYGLPAAVFTSEASKRALLRGARNYYLPMAFTAGSPPHPSYGAGHATVAGACVTVLKAWFAGKTKLAPLLLRAGRNPFDDTTIVISQTSIAGVLVDYMGTDASEMTVEGELNKIACNVAMGRSMGGVHWRSDNTRSLRLGEQIATELLRAESLGYAEKNYADGALPYWSFTSFDGDEVVIHAGRVLVSGVPVDPKSGPL